MEYTVKIDKVDTPNMSYDSSAECLEIALEEYRHVTERANKYDNKIYIMITFCSVFFAFILTFFYAYTCYWITTNQITPF